MIVNGCEYPLWSQFIERQDEWKGGLLEDFGDNVDKMIGLEPMSTEITGIQLRPNGNDSAFFEVTGKEFSCGFDVQHGGISGGRRDQLQGSIVFQGYGGHTWRISKPK